LHIICLALGLIILIIVNIVLGSLSALFQNTYCRKKLLCGLIKAGIVLVCFAGTYLVGYLNPGIVAVEVDGVEVTVMTGIQLVVLVGYYHYAKQVIEKLTAIVKGNMFAEEIELFGGGSKNRLPLSQEICGESTRENSDEGCDKKTEAFDGETGCDKEEASVTDLSDRNPNTVDKTTTGGESIADFAHKSAKYDIEGNIRLAFVDDER
jgi:hypothetical protein